MVTQQNASASTHSATAAEQLSAQAVQMKALVDRLYTTIRGEERRVGHVARDHFTRSTLTLRPLMRPF